jgi:hypothetical protein
MFIAIRASYIIGFIRLLANVKDPVVKLFRVNIIVAMVEGWFT